MKQKNHGSAAKKIAICAMLSALGVVFLLLGSVVDVLDMSMAVFTSLLSVIAVIEYGKSAPWMIYGCTSLLSLLLLPNKIPAVLYSVFFGFYPIVKEKFEKKNIVISWLLKHLVFLPCFALMLVAYLFLGTGFETYLLKPWVIAAVVALAEIIFILYDLALTRMITLYIVKLRKRLKFFK